MLGSVKQEHNFCVFLCVGKMEGRPDVRARELLDEFFEKQDEPQYMRNVLSGLSGIMLVGFVFTSTCEKAI